MARVRFSVITTLVFYWLTAVAAPAVAQVDQQRAQQFFKEVQTLRERDWNASGASRSACRL